MSNVVSLQQVKAAKSHANAKRSAQQIQKDVYTTIFTALQDLQVDLVNDHLAYVEARRVCLAFSDVAINHHLRMQAQENG